MIPCLIAPIPPAGRNMLQMETLYARRAGLSCSIRTHVTVDGRANGVQLTAYCYKRPHTQLIDGKLHVPCLTAPVPAEGRHMLPGEVRALARMAPGIEAAASSYYIIPWLDGAVLPYCSYTGNYLLMQST
jgi:hypothetical protein